MKRTPENYANGFAAVYGEALQVKNELLRLRALFVDQIQMIDDFISGASRRTYNITNPGDCIKWAHEWAQISRKEADEEKP